MQVVLVMFRADGERRSFSVAREMTVIGRREDCDLRIPLTDVSRKHCRIVKDAEGVRIEDLGSSNGTYHNGVRVQEAWLQPGDQVQIGTVIFVVQIDGVPSEEEMIASPSGGTAAGAVAPIAAADGEFASAEEVQEVEALEELPTIDELPSESRAGSLAVEPETLEAVEEVEAVEEIEPVEEVEALEEVPAAPQSAGELTEVESLEEVAELEPITEVEPLGPTDETPAGELEELTEVEDLPESFEAENPEQVEEVELVEDVETTHSDPDMIELEDTDKKPSRKK